MIGHLMRVKNGVAGQIIRLPLNGNARDMQGFNNFTYQAAVTGAKLYPMPIGNLGSTNFHNASPDNSGSITSHLSSGLAPMLSGYAGDWSVEFFMYFTGGSFVAPVAWMPENTYAGSPPYPINTMQAFGASFRIAGNGTSFTDTNVDNYSNKWYWFRFRKRTLATSGKGLYVDYAPWDNLNNVKSASHLTSQNMAAYPHALGIGSYPQGQNDGTTNLNGYMCDVRVFMYERTGPPNY